MCNKKKERNSIVQGLFFGLWNNKTYAINCKFESVSQSNERITWLLKRIKRACLLNYIKLKIKCISFALVFTHKKAFLFLESKYLNFVLINWHCFDRDRVINKLALLWPGVRRVVRSQGLVFQFERNLLPFTTILGIFNIKIEF